MRFRFAFFFSVCVSCLGLAAAAEPRAKSPDESLKAMRIAPGFDIELVATEPLVKDPIAFEWGADGKLWVVEMGDYPLGVDGKGKPGGVVRFLEDRDGDGRYDTQTTFLDGLGFPTGVFPWRSGVLIACAPDIFFAEDRDGDGRADHCEVLFTGFGQGNQQHRLNGFDLGLDGWIHGANGDSDGKVRSLRTGKITSISGRDFRFRSDTGEFEAESGRTQYGRHRDDWGHWFGNNNPNWGWHYVLASHDLKRNPSFAPPDPRHTLEPDTRLYPVSTTAPRFNDPGAANHVTSANSPTPYRDDLFGPEFATSLFVSEPVHNLVHRMIVEPQGVTFRGFRAPAESNSEFIASRDPWFRPTMLKTGPDGALWIADMYRAVIEHPEWIPDDWERQLDLRAGSEEGRIYRVYPTGKKPRKIPHLDRLSTTELVAAIESPGGWQRDTAQRLLLHRRDPDAVEPLRRLVKHNQSPKTCVQAVWTLADLDGLDEASALAALGHSDARVRAAVVAATVPIVPRSRPVADALLRLAGDANAEVRFQVALALGDCDLDRAAAALARMARRDGTDPWMRAALLSSAPRHAEALLLALLRDPEPPAVKAPPADEIVGPLFALVLARNGGKADGLITRTITVPAGQGGRYADWQFNMLASVLDARNRARRGDGLDLVKGPFAAVWDAARHTLGNNAASDADRAGAARLIGYQRPAEHGRSRRTRRALRPQVSLSLQQAAVAALGQNAETQTADRLLADWKGYSPAIRQAILDMLMKRTDWTSSLLSSLEDGCVSSAELDPARRQQLLRHRNGRLRARAETVFAYESKPRQAVVETFRPALALKGDKTAGAAIFRKLCASCHRFGGEGTEVGPDLASLQDRSPEALLIAILDPNRAFESKFTNFSVATVDGRVLNGLIASESAAAVTLLRQDGKQEALLRSVIDELKSSGQSLMPEGLEKDLTPRTLADLIAFLTGPAPAPAAPTTRKPE